MRSIGTMLAVLVLTAVVVAVLFAWLVRTSRALSAVTHRVGGSRIGLGLLGAALGALVGEVLLALSESWSASTFAWDPADGAKNACDPAKYAGDPVGFTRCLRDAFPAAGAGAAGGAIGGAEDKYGGYKDPNKPQHDRPYGPQEPPPGYQPFPDRSSPDYVGGEHDPAFQRARDEYAHEHRDTTPSTPPSKYDQGKQTFIRSILTGGGKANR